MKNPKIKMISALFLSFLCSAAFGQAQWPFKCAPAIVTGTAINPERIVGLTSGIPKVFVNRNGAGLLWGCRLEDGKVYPSEIHATSAFLTDAKIKEIQEGAKTDPLGTFWKNAKSPSCFAPGATWPTAAERALCKTMQTGWTTWALK